MRFRRTILVLMLTVPAASPVWGQERGVEPQRDTESVRFASGAAISPDDAVRRAITESDVVRAIRSDAEAARAVFRQARAARYPSVSALATYTRLSDNIPEIAFDTDALPGFDTTFTLAPVVLNRYYSEIAVEQPLFTGFELHHQIRAARFEAEAVLLEAAQREADLAFQVREAFWSLYQARAGVEAADQAVAQVGAHLEDVQNFRDAGAALESEVLTARTRALEVQLQRAEAEDAAALAQLELNRLLDLPLDTELQLQPELEAETSEELELASTLNRALERNSALASLSAQVDALEAGLQSVEGSWFPDVALNGRYVYARPNQYFFMDQDAFKPTWEAGVALRWSIWDGGSRSARIQEARARLESARTRLDEVRDELSVEVTHRVLAVERAANMLDMAEQNVAAAEEALRILRNQYAQGAALSSDVLDAEQAFRSALARRAQAVADLAIARAALKRSEGQIW